MNPTLLAVPLALVVLLHAALVIATRVLTRRAEAAHPPIGRFVETPGRRLHYRETGPIEAPAIVLLHGASTSLLDFETSLRPRLDGRFRVIAVDRPGSGWSDAAPPDAGDPLRHAEAALAVLDTLGIERALWVGHSWGGAVVMAALLEHSDRATGGVAIAGAVQPWEEHLPWQIRLIATPVAGKLLAATWLMPLARNMLPDATRDTFRPEPPPADLEGYLEASGAVLAIRPASLRATARDMVGLPRSLESLAARYGEIERPLLLVSGSADPLIAPERNAEPTAASVPSARMLRIPDAGHIVHHTHPDQVASAIEAFAIDLTVK